jgi:hypothetical protein
MIMVLFGNEFNLDERAEVGGGLRGGEVKLAMLASKLSPHGICLAKNG